MPAQRHTTGSRRRQRVYALSQQIQFALLYDGKLDIRAMETTAGPDNGQQYLPKRKPRRSEGRGEVHLMKSKQSRRRR